MANLETTAEITKLMQEQTKIFGIQAKMMQGQLATMKAIASVMQEMPAEEISKNFAAADAAAKSAEEAIEGMAAATNKVDESAKKAAKSTKIMGTGFDDLLKKAMKVSIALEGWNKFKSSVSVVSNLVKGVVSTFTTLLGVLFDIGVSIMSAPFKWLGSLISGAGQGGGGEFRQAVEDVRKEFGQLATNEAKAVMKGFKGIQGDLAETGISARRILGNMAERLKAIAELATKMGPAFSALQDSFKDPQQIERMAAYQKGLGLTDEGIQGLSTRAIATGKSFSELGREITNYAFKLGDAFNVNGKIVARAVGTMMSDYKNFGNISIKTMTQAALYTRKLGLETKELLGVIDKFDDFESAADGAAQLSQAFGMNVDALALIKEQDPAKRFEMLRSEFVKTGKDINALTRQERALLAAQTGLSDEALLKGFNKQAMSYEEIEKESKKAEKQQLTQAQAMDKLAMSIERLVKSGGGIDGFFDAFIKGIGIGMERSKEFREMFRSIQRALQATLQAGIAVGRAIIDTWPGMKEMFAGVRDFFKEIGSFTDKLKPKGIMMKVAGAFKDFLADPKASPEGLFNQLKKYFFDLFDTNNPNVAKAIDGAKKVFKRIFEVMAGAIRFGIKEMTNLLTNTTGIFAALKNPNGPEWQKIMGNASSSQGGITKFLLEMLKPFIDIWNDPTLLTNFKNAIFDFLEAGWDLLKLGFDTHIMPHITKYWDENGGKIMLGLGTVIFGPAIVSMLVASMIKGLAIVLGNFIAKGAPMAAEATASVLSKKKTMEAVAEAAETVPGLSDAGKKVNPMSVKNILVLAGALLAIGLAIAVTMWGISKVAGSMSTEEIAKTAAVMTSGAIAFGIMAVGMAALIAAGSLIQLSMGTAIIAALAGLGGLALIAGAMAFAFLGMQSTFRKIDMIALGKLEAVIGAMSIALAAAGAVLVASGFIGTITVFSAGISFLLVTAGLSVLISIINTMVDSCIEIINKLDKLNLSSSFGMKIDSFGRMLGFFVDIIKLVVPFLSEGAQLSASDAARNIENLLDPITSFVSKLIGSFSKLIGIMTKDEVKTGDLEKIGAISPIIGSLSEIIKAVLPAAELLSGKKDDIISKLEGASAYVKSLTNMLVEYLLPSIQILLESGLKGIEKIPMESVEKFKTIFSVLSSIFASIVPSVEFINSFKTFKKSSTENAGSKNDYQESAINIDAMRDALGAMGGALTGFLNSGLGADGWINSVLSIMDKLPAVFAGKNINKSSTQSFNTLIKVIEGMKVIAEFFGKQSELTSWISGVGGKNHVDLFLTNFKVYIIDPLLGRMPKIMSSFEQIDQNIKDVSIARIEKVRKSLSGMVKVINDTDSGIQTLLNSPLHLEANIGKVVDKIGLKNSAEYKFNRGELNVTVQLEVKIDAEDLAFIVKKQKAFKGTTDK